MRILIADDDRLSAHILGASLKASGYQVTMATNGDEAWQILQSPDPPRVAILDWLMPGMDGLQVCRKIRQAAGPYVYVLLLTGNTDISDVVIGMDAGADDYIKKPFNPDEFQARLRTGLRIVELEEKLRFQATHDSLTGVMNRGAIMDRLKIELQRASREASSLSVAMVDLDHFKEINDTHGHVAGDLVLSETAGKMSATLRPYDLVGRYGGEEFIIVFPNADLALATQIAERLRTFISSKPVDVGASKIPVTASIGIADNHRFGDCDSLVSAADAALFRAKNGGRNRVETADARFANGAASR